ncbi:MAG TPA: hypothetical protein VEB21_20395 [Terriglobales bacterium]|nr:hypothetical protein [Terriglobales bacterium]
MNYQAGCSLSDYRNYDARAIATAALFGGIAPGWLSVGTQTRYSLGAIRALSGQLGNSRTAARIAKVKARISAHQVGILDAVATQTGFQAIKSLGDRLSGAPADEKKCRCP